MTGDGRPAADGRAHGALAGRDRLGELREALLATEVPVPTPGYEERLRAATKERVRRAASLAGPIGRRVRAEAPTVARSAAVLSLRATAWSARALWAGIVLVARAIRAARVGSKARVALRVAARSAMLVTGAGIRAMTRAILWLGRRIRAAGARPRPRRIEARAKARLQVAERPPTPALPHDDPVLRRAQRSLELAIAVHGTSHAETASGLHLVAAIHHDAGRHAEAGPLYESVIAIRESALGPAHPLLAQTLEDLAALRRETGDDAAAAALIERSRAIRAASSGVAERGLGVSAA